MENLSDAEFGSKSVEEAPILIAQRYLNIFRQVHIFNKDTRNKFDDELLALPENIIGFIKRMPGGRLLIEHIEEVKTERGISFVRSNRDEFTNGADTTAGASNAVVPMQGGGGSVVMDSSFAETLANSLASAFKNVPAATPGGHAFSTPTDMGQAFELIAEEIRASHSSLLDVLKETRNITDSVIASQVSISRILEGLLSSRTVDGSNNDLTNQIIASQASITKLLENLYNSHPIQSEKSDKYFDIENRLSRFEHEIRDEIKSLLANNISNLSSLSKVNTDVQPTLQTHEKTIDIRDSFANNETNKKKKKKNKNKEQLSAVAAPLVAATSFDSQKAVLDNILDNVSDNNMQSIDGVIRNSAYKHEDDFSNVNLNEPPLEPSEALDILNTKDVTDEHSSDILADLNNLDDIDLSSVVDDAPTSESIKEDSFIKEKPISDDDLEGSISGDDLSNPISDDDLNLDNFAQGDISSFNTDSDSEISAEETMAPNIDNNIPASEINLASVATDESLDNILSHKENTIDPLETIPAAQENTDTIEAAQSLSEDVENLDDIQVTSSNEDGVLSNSVSENALEAEELNTDNINLDDLNTEETSEEPLSSGAEISLGEEADEDINLAQNNVEQPSRFNDTLDKIRDALTSDHIDISSLEEPIALDDYSDDENVSEDDIPMRKTSNAASSDDEEWEYEYVEDDGHNTDDENATEDGDDGDWEYEYVDENGNVITSKGEEQEGEDWEWEYVDDDQSKTSDDNNNPQ